VATLTIQPLEDLCDWSQESPPGVVEEDPHVTFNMSCLVTNETPGPGLAILRVELVGVKGKPTWHGLSMHQPEDEEVPGAVLTPGAETHLSCQVVLQRSKMPPGPKMAGIVIYDHLGRRHQAPKVTFKDANPPLTEAEPIDVWDD
jgi:hypothetical protein